MTPEPLSLEGDGTPSRITEENSARVARFHPESLPLNVKRHIGNMKSIVRKELSRLRVGKHHPS